MTLLRTIDAFALVSALLAAWLWYRASSVPVRRVARDEEIDHLDLNRIVTAINRTQALNRRAALATAVSAGVIALRFAYDVLVRG
jgi:hypothetical protein